MRPHVFDKFASVCVGGCDQSRPWVRFQAYVVLRAPRAAAGVVGGFTIGHTGPVCMAWGCPETPVSRPWGSASRSGVAFLLGAKLQLSYRRAHTKPTFLAYRFAVWWVVQNSRKLCSTKNRSSSSVSNRCHKFSQPRDLLFNSIEYQYLHIQNPAHSETFFRQEGAVM